MPKLTAARALTAHIAKRFVRLATIIVFVIFIIAMLGSAALAHFFNGWWWLLVVPFILAFGLFLLIRIVILFFVRRIHAEQLTNQQNEALDAFTSKLERLVEARGTPPPIFVLITIKDLVLHRDITTVKELIRDTASFRSDYDKLNELF